MPPANADSHLNQIDVHWLLASGDEKRRLRLQPQLAGISVLIRP
jgi:hypothetical protein